MEGNSFGSIAALIRYQEQNNIPVTKKSKVFLYSPVLRGSWELNNSDIITLEKIGNVSITGILPY